MTNDDGLLYERRGAISLITLNRPEKMNALTLGMLSRLDSLLGEIDDDPAQHVTVITGAGDAFCAGGDLDQTIPHLTTSLRDTTRDPCHKPLSHVAKPVIAAVNGVCMAGGMEILLGTDLRVASDDAVFALPEVRVGLIPLGGGTVRLPRQIPWARAMELLLLGNAMKAPEALAFGLVNRVVPKPDVLPTALDMAERILRNGPLAVRRAKEAALKSYTQSWADAFYTEFLIGVEVFDSHDAKEGPGRVQRERAPVFNGN